MVGVKLGLDSIHSLVKLITNGVIIYKYVNGGLCITDKLSGV